jgi:hypothetical protein
VPAGPDRAMYEQADRDSVSRDSELPVACRKHPSQAIDDQGTTTSATSRLL